MHNFALVALAATPSPSPVEPGPGAAVWASPVFWLALACAIGGLGLIAADSWTRAKTLEQTAVITTSLAALTDARTALVTAALQPTSAEQAANLAVAQSQLQQDPPDYSDFLATYQALFLKHPQLVAGVTLLLGPVLVVGGFAFGSAS